MSHGYGNQKVAGSNPGIRLIWDTWKRRTINNAHISEASSLHDEIVDCVSWNPEHRCQRHYESDAVSPKRIFDAPVFDRRPTDDVEDEDRLKIVKFVVLSLFIYNLF